MLQIKSYNQKKIKDKLIKDRTIHFVLIMSFFLFLEDDYIFHHLDKKELGAFVLRYGQEKGDIIRSSPISI